MKKVSILLLMLLFVEVCNAAGDSTKTKKIEIGISFSPDYSYRTLKPDADSKWIADGRDTLEVPKFGYTVGADIKFKLTKKFDLEAGILFSDAGEKTNKFSLDESTAGQKAIMYSYNFHYYYLNIPVKADYYFLTGKLKLYVTAGISANIFLGQKTTMITSYGNSDLRKSSKADPGFSTVNLAVLGGLGIRYPINAKTNLMIEPIYRRSITSIINAPIKGYLYSAGLNIGIYHTF